MMNLMNFICKMLCKLIVAELSITLAGAAEKREISCIAATVGIVHTIGLYGKHSIRSGSHWHGPVREPVLPDK